MSFMISTFSALALFFWVLWGKTTYLPVDKRLIKTSLFCIIGIIIYMIIASVCSEFSELLTDKFGIAFDFFIAAISEEIIKFLAVYMATSGLRNVRRNIDILLYAIVSAISFAVLENFFYCLNFEESIGFIRCIYSVPSHVLFTMVVSIFALRYLKDLKFFNIVLGILITGFIHGFYNICAISDTVIIACGANIGFIFEIVLLCMIIKEYKKCFYRHFM